MTARTACHWDVKKSDPRLWRGNLGIGVELDWLSGRCCSAQKMEALTPTLRDAESPLPASYLFGASNKADGTKCYWS